MAFTVHGYATVSWDDGDIDGDRAGLALVRELVDEAVPIHITPTGQTYIAALEPDYVALATLIEAVGPDVDLEGEIPEYPAADIEIPEGATP